jgi:hypothetical protein
MARRNHDAQSDQPDRDEKEPSAYSEKFAHPSDNGGDEATREAGIWAVEQCGKEVIQPHPNENGYGKDDDST